MKKSDVKYGVLAGLCLLLTVPILGYVQKQSVARPAPPNGMSPRQRFHQGQRRALYEWLMGSMRPRAVVASDENRRVIEVALNPVTTPAQLLDQARRVRQIMAMYFREGSEGAVTAVVLRANRERDTVSIRTGLEDTQTRRDTSWHILAGSKVID